MNMQKDQDHRDSRRGGEPEDIEKVFSLYGNRLFRAAYLLCRDESDARDLVQETFLQALKSIKKFKAKSTLYTWLYGILLNVFRNHVRKKRFLPLSSEISSNDSDSTVRVESRLDQERVFSRIFKLIHSLSSVHREVLILRYYEDMKIKEIAEITGVSQGTVKSRLYYATSFLRERMSDDLNFFKI